MTQYLQTEQLSSYSVEHFLTEYVLHSRSMEQYFLDY